MKLTAIILAGGKSSRMGQDKGLMLFNEKPMIQYVIDGVKPLVNEIIIIANNNQYQKFGYPVYQDLIKNKGPLAGIYTGLTHSTTTKNIVLSCDVPFVSQQLIQELINHCNDVEVVIPEKNKITHQLIGVYDKSCTVIFKKELENNQLKLKLAIEKLNYKIVDANHIKAKLFTNINSKDDITA